jgi:hypothetical protein
VITARPALSFHAALARSGKYRLFPQFRPGGHLRTHTAFFYYIS